MAGIELENGRQTTVDVSTRLAVNKRVEATSVSDPGYSEWFFVHECFSTAAFVEKLCSSYKSSKERTKQHRLNLKNT